MRWDHTSRRDLLTRGLIALQVHVEQSPVEMQFKDLWIKVL